MPSFVLEYIYQAKQWKAGQKWCLFWAWKTWDCYCKSYIAEKRDSLWYGNHRYAHISGSRYTPYFPRRYLYKTWRNSASHLYCNVIKYPGEYIRNQSVYKKLFEQQEEIKEPLIKAPTKTYTIEIEKKKHRPMPGVKRPLSSPHPV